MTTHVDRPMRRPLVTVLLVIALVGAAIGGTAWLAGRDGASGFPADDSAEAGFARAMSAHHGQAVAMAETVRRSSTDEEILVLATDIALTQQSQIGQMRGWLEQWELPIGSAVSMAWMGMPAGATMPGMASSEDLAALSTLAAPQVETLFLQLMVSHHRGGVAMAQAVLDRTEREEVRRLAGAIVESQSAEVETMAALLAERDAPVPNRAAPMVHSAGGGDRENLGVVDAVILGVVEGVTEYLPVSSTGHLTVANRILDVGQNEDTDDAADSFVVAIQAGAIVAVLVLYRRRVGRVVAGVVGRDAEGRRLAASLALSFLPAVVLALSLEAVIKDELFAAGPVIAAWIVGGVAILVWCRWGRSAGALPIEALSYRAALFVGVAQCLALWPGVSRSLVTIVAALVVGLTQEAAVEYSFLLGLLTLGAATSYELTTNGGSIIEAFGWTPFGAGLLAAFVAAMAAVTWMVTYLQRHSLAVFGWYRIAAGSLALALVAGGAI